MDERHRSRSVQGRRRSGRTRYLPARLIRCNRRKISGVSYAQVRRSPQHHTMPGSPVRKACLSRRTTSSLEINGLIDAG